MRGGCERCVGEEGCVAVGVLLNGLLLSPLAMQSSEASPIGEADPFQFNAVSGPLSATIRRAYTGQGCDGYSSDSGLIVHCSWLYILFHTICY